MNNEIDESIVSEVKRAITKFRWFRLTSLFWFRLDQCMLIITLFVVGIGSTGIIWLTIAPNFEGDKTVLYITLAALSLFFKVIQSVGEFGRYAIIHHDHATRMSHIIKELQLLLLKKKEIEIIEILRKYYKMYYSMKRVSNSLGEEQQIGPNIKEKIDLMDNVKGVEDGKCKKDENDERDNDSDIVLTDEE